MSGFGLGSAIFNYVILGLVNPHDENMDEHNRYPEHIANNLPFALKILSVIYIGMGLLGSALIRPPKRSQGKNYTLLTEGN